MRRARGPAALYFLLTLAWSWPLPLHLTDRFTHDPGDPLFITYVMWWNAQTRLFTAAWWSPPFFWPMRDALALTDHLAGLWPLSTPLQALGASPLTTYNIVLLCATWWTLIATHALVRRITGSSVAAACGAIAFAFSPYRTSELGHLQLYACWWIPLSLLAVYAYARDGRRRWLVVLALSWLFEAMTNGYYLFFLPLLLAAWTICVTPWRTHARRALHVAATWVMASLALLPVLLHYHHVQSRLGLTRSRPEMAFFSATWKALLAVEPNLLFWHSGPPSTTEAYLFPGITGIVLIAAALVVRVRDRILWFTAVAAALTFWLCAGPAPDGPSLASLWHPYDWLLWLPGFSGLRVPARFFMMTAMCLAIGAGVAFAHLRGRVRHPAVLATVVFAGLFVDGAIRGMPLGVPPGRLPLGERNARILALPFDDLTVSVPLMYQSMPLRLRVVNGYAGYIPVHADVILWALRRSDASVLTELRRGQPLYVLVGSTQESDRWQTFMDAQPGAEFIGVEGGGRMYRMPAAPYRDAWPPGRPLAIARASADPGWLVADLGAPHTVRSVQVRTRGELALMPASLRVETSLDGRDWRIGFDDAPGGAALNGALEDPRQVPIRVAVPDTTARYIRVNTPFYDPSALVLYGG